MSLVIPLFAVVPALVLLVYFNARQNYHLSADIVWSAVMLGAAVSLLAVAAETLLIGPLNLLAEVFGGDIMPRILARAFIGTALPEELAKFLVLTWIIFKHEDFERPVDAMVLAVAVTLGFAAFENLLYVMEAENWWRTAAIRAMTAVPSHVVNAMLMGYFLGLGQLMPWRRRIFTILAILVPVLNHGAYDAPLFALDALESKFGALSAAQSQQLILSFAIIIALGSLVALFAWYDLLRRDEQDLAKQAFVYEVRESGPRARRLEAVAWVALGTGLFALSLLLALGGFVLPIQIAPTWTAYYPEYFMLTTAILPCLFGGAMMAHGLQRFRP